EHAGARVTIAACEDAVQACLDIGQPLVLIADDMDGPGHAEWLGPFEVLPNVHHLRIARGQHRVMQLVNGGAITVDGRSLRRRSLLRAAAAAAGLVAPPAEQPLPENQPEKAGASPLTITQARVRGQLILVAEDDSTNQKVLLR